MIEIKVVELSDCLDRLNDDISSLWEYGMETMNDYVMSKCKKIETAVNFIRHSVV